MGINAHLVQKSIEIIGTNAVARRRRTEYLVARLPPRFSSRNTCFENG